jgi:hypothetical protein
MRKTRKRVTKGTKQLLITIQNVMFFGKSLSSGISEHDAVEPTKKPPEQRVMLLFLFKYNFDFKNI